MPTLRERPGERYRPRTRKYDTNNNPKRSLASMSAMRKHFVAATGEFVGTFLFLFLAFLGHSMSASQAGVSGPNGTASSEQVVFVALSYGLSLLVTAWSLYRISGGLFNPAVTLGLVIAGELSAVRGLILFPVQIIGATCAAAVVSAIIPGDIAVVQTTLGANVSIAQGVFLEMFLTSQLVLTILVLAAEKSKDTFIAPIGIGLALFIVEIAGVYYTGASVNPARSFGPCIAALKFQGYHWIYWVGPFLGALLAAGYYKFVKWMNYGDLGGANPGQDSADGAFHPQVEEQQSRSADEGRISQSYTAQESQTRSSWNNGRRPESSWNGIAPRSPSKEAWHSDNAYEMNERNANMDRRGY